jgi:hypothetical protein
MMAENSMSRGQALVNCCLVVRVGRFNQDLAQIARVTYELGGKAIRYR